MSNSTRNWLIVAIVFVAALGSVLQLESAEEAKRPAVQKWEYTWTNTNENLKTLGDQGWELVAAYPVGEHKGKALYFKRPQQ